MENLDVTRLVNIASGGNFFPVGDVVDGGLSACMGLVHGSLLILGG